MTTPRLAEQIRGKGRMYRHPETGVLVPSVTNVVGMLDKPALPRWAAKSVAEHAWEIRGRLAAADSEQREFALRELKQAPWSYAQKRADVGSLVHAIADALATDSPLPAFGDEEAAYADQFLDWVSEMDVKFLASEVTVFGPGYAGTFDWYAQIGDQFILGDHKTGKAVYPEVALQLAGLRYADEWVVDGSVEPVRCIDRCAVLHLRSDGWTLHEVDVDNDTYAAFFGLLDAWRWRHRDGDHISEWNA